MQRANLFWEFLEVIPAIPVVLYHVTKELIEDGIKFFVRPSEVEWPEPSSANKIV
ncbi:MAG TPA: hypothetical protein VGL38_00320 [bacterium]|jgi:hypothetical protein